MRKIVETNEPVFAMNSMNDERFFDLAMKVIACQATDAERAELDALLARDAKLRAAFEQLQADVRVAKDALPLVDATQSETGELPAYARGRLQTKVRQTLGSPAAEEEPDRSFAWGWRWALGLAAAAAVVLFVALPMFRPPNSINTHIAIVQKRPITIDSNTQNVALTNNDQPSLAQISPTNSEPESFVIKSPSTPLIQLAMLNISGIRRGTETNEAFLFLESWSVATLDSFTNAEALREWESKGKPDAVKIIYDRAAAEVRVLGKWRGKSFGKTFLIEQNLAATLTQARAFIGEQTRR